MNYAKNDFRALLAAVMILAGSILTGCQSNNSSYDNGSIKSEPPAGDATTMDSTQGNPVNESMTSGDNVSDRPVDNTAAMPTKKGTKGKASINIKRMNRDRPSMMVPDAEGVYARTDIMPLYPGGEKALQQYIENNIEYPQEAIDQGAEGDIRIAFTVNEKGKVTNVKAVDDNNTEYTLKQEAIDVISKMPDWTPGTVKGKKVKTRLYMPISFQIIE
ncbi:energy transducer TonB [Paraflavitalea sp. CAU 1676]|uniref:energy transducer TonB n=1 Tax=Paraflavitalea sp. CAU 1676 TaxID=3032598 RepID=UPI0023DBFF5F|nr:energy transducer TonB [Paraflavitalea sp. CAU 1676]MDF2193395.1 energy transducer TonB [Paraflavitalea sp. CAU 1676]